MFYLFACQVDKGIKACFGDRLFGCDEYLLHRWQRCKSLFPQCIGIYRYLSGIENLQTVIGTFLFDHIEL